MRSHLARWARLSGMSGSDPLFDGRAPAAFARQWADARADSRRYLQRRRDGERLALHTAVFAVMAALTAWWVIPHHAFRPPRVAGGGPSARRTSGASVPSRAAAITRSSRERVSAAPTVRHGV